MSRDETPTRSSNSPGSTFPPGNSQPPAKAGGLIEEQHRIQRNFSAMTERERAEMLQRHGWELLGPSPL